MARSETTERVAEWLTENLELVPNGVVTHREMQRRLVLSGIIDERKQIAWRAVHEAVAPRLGEGGTRMAKLRPKGEKGAPLASWVGVQFKMGAPG